MLTTADPLEALTERIIGCAIEVHRELGPGLLESIYKECLMRELTAEHMTFEQEAPLTVVYKGCTLTQKFRLDRSLSETITELLNLLISWPPA
jgi:GxxExxY protein